MLSTLRTAPELLECLLAHAYSWFILEVAAAFGKFKIPTKEIIKVHVTEVAK